MCLKILCLRKKCGIVGAVDVPMDATPDSDKSSGDNDRQGEVSVATKAAEEAGKVRTIGPFPPPGGWVCVCVCVCVCVSLSVCVLYA